MALKEEVIEILKPIFGSQIKEIINKDYDEKNPKELYEMAKHMLNSFMGEKKATEVLSKLNYPKNKKVS